MNKSDIVTELAKRMQIDQATAAAALENILDIIVRNVVDDEDVTIMGFGTFQRRERAARMARNPHTGEAVRVAPTHVPMFRAGGYFRAVVKGDMQLPESGISVKRVATTPFAQNSARKAAGDDMTATTHAEKTREKSAGSDKGDKGDKKVRKDKKKKSDKKGKKKSKK